MFGVSIDVSNVWNILGAGLWARPLSLKARPLSLKIMIKQLTKLGTKKMRMTRKGAVRVLGRVGGWVSGGRGG